MEGNLTETPIDDPTPLGLPLDPIARSLLDSKAFAVFFIDDQGNIVDCNQEAAERLQYRRDELLALSLTDINPDLKSIEQYRSEFFPQIAAGQRLHLSMKHRRKDGCVFPTEIDAHLVVIDGRQIVCSYVRDVRDTNIKTLREVNDRLQSTIYVYDLNQNRNLYVNKNIGIQLGYSPDETVEMGDDLFRLLLHPDDVGKVALHHQNVVSMNDGESRDVEYRMRHRNGEYRRLHSRDAIFKRDDDGTVLQVVGVATLLDEIESLRLQSEQLKMANEELQSFAYIASHDLKAPLRGVSHLTDWLREDAGDLLTPESLEYIDKIKGRIERMNHLLDSLLEYSRVGRTKLEVTEFNLGRLLDATLEWLPRPDTFTITTENVDIDVCGHQSPLSQVLQNLVSNAIKYRARDDGHVSIAASVINDRMHLAVTDDGLGVEPKYRERIFEMFQTLGQNGDQSTGIGLTIARKHVQQHGGKLNLVDSDQPSGCRFEFDWPIRI